MKCETVDMSFTGKNFRDYVHTQDIPSIERHFQEGESSDIYSVLNYTDIFISRSVLYRHQRISE
jgi:hypothetical protein